MNWHTKVHTSLQAKQVSSNFSQILEIRITIIILLQTEESFYIYLGKFHFVFITLENPFLLSLHSAFIYIRTEDDDNQRFFSPYQSSRVYVRHLPQKVVTVQ